MAPSGTTTAVEDFPGGSPSEDECAYQPDDPVAVDKAPAPRNSWRLLRWLAFAVLPAVVLLLSAGAGYLRWQDGVARQILAARTQSMHAAIDSTVAMLSYHPGTVESELHAARDRLTGNFRDSYTSLINDVVIPGAKQKAVTAVATAPAAASVSATPDSAVVLVFVNQSIIIGEEPPTSTASSVRVTLDKVDDRWLISDFTPV